MRFNVFGKVRYTTVSNTLKRAKEDNFLQNAIKKIADYLNVIAKRME